MVSIILPTYNNESTIDRAIFSVVSQTDPDWELIIVDDASTDNTRQIVNKYFNLYSQKIRIIRNTENSGVGISRRNALKYVKGEFITFLDSDDFLMADFIRTCKKTQSAYAADVVFPSLCIIWPEGQREMVTADPNVYVDRATTNLHFNIKRKFLTGKLFKTSIVKNIPWSNERWGEDVQILFYILYEATRAVAAPYCGYIHYFRPNSLLADAPFETRFIGSMGTDQDICDYLIEKGDETMWKYVLTSTVRNQLIMDDMIKNNKANTDLLKKDIDRYQRILDWFESHQSYIDQLDLSGDLSTTNPT